jgi:hypothetical protein
MEALLVQAFCAGDLLRAATREMDFLLGEETDTPDSR